MAAIYLWRKVVCFALYCSYEIHQTGMLQIVFLVSLESSWRGGGAWAWFYDIFGLVVQKFLNIDWMISSLKILKINRSWKFWEELECAFGVLGKILMSTGFNGIYLVTFGFKMWEILNLKVTSAAENSNKFQKTRFWKEKSVEDVVSNALILPQIIPDWYVLQYQHYIYLGCILYTHIMLN
jgi:hypothetical protein